MSPSSRGKIASALSRLLGIGREANATEPAKSEAASPPAHTGAIVARPEQPQSQPQTAVLFEKTTMAEMKVLTAQPVVSSANFESRWSAIR
jgi:hypothetical protein